MNGLEGKNGVTKGNVDSRVGDIKRAVRQAYSPGTAEFIRAKKIVKTKFGKQPWERGLLDDEGLFLELDVLHEWLQRTLAESDLREEYKLRTNRLYEQVEARYRTLTSDEIQTVVVEDKWMTGVEVRIGQEAERLTGGLVDRIRMLEGRYAKPLPELVGRVEVLAGKVERHLADLGVAL